MTDTSGMVPAIEDDRTGGPWVELWGDWLQRIYVTERTLPLPLGDVGVAYIMFTVRTCGGNLFCPLVCDCRGSSSSSLCSLLSLFSAFNLPACLNTQHSLLVWLDGLSGGVMYLAQAVEYTVQTGRAQSASFEWLVPLTLV